MKSVKYLLDLMEKHEPQNESQFMRSCRAGLRYMGEGCFRVTFEVMGYPLVLKVPLTNTYPDLHHANEEWRWIQAVKKESRYKVLRRYMPKVYYFDEHHGLMLMHKYEVMWKADKEALALDKLITDVTGSTGHDVGAGNLGWDDKGRLKILDTGLLGWSEPLD